MMSLRSVLTVGFGDLAPRNDSFTLVVLLIILAGLVLTTTCVDIVGAYYIDRLHFFGRRLEDVSLLNNLDKILSISGK